MADYKIVVTLSDSQDATVRKIAETAGKTIEELFQQFWDGYVADGVKVEGSVHAQVRQWLADVIANKLSNIPDEELFDKLVDI